MTASASCPTDPAALQTAPTDHVSAAYRAALDFLYARINYEQLPREQYSAAGFKLDRMQALLQRIGDPQLSLPAIHIAGTKGKGSTAAICVELGRNAVGFELKESYHANALKNVERYRQGAKPKDSDQMTLEQLLTGQPVEV